MGDRPERRVGDFFFRYDSYNRGEIRMERITPENIRWSEVWQPTPELAAEHALRRSRTEGGRTKVQRALAIALRTPGMVNPHG